MKGLRRGKQKGTQARKQPAEPGNSSTKINEMLFLLLLARIARDTARDTARATARDTAGESQESQERKKEGHSQGNSWESQDKAFLKPKQSAPKTSAVDSKKLSSGLFYHIFRGVSECVSE